MNKGLLVGLGIAGVILILAISIAIWAIGVSNKEIELRTAFNARVLENQTNYDNMWKTIQQKYQLKGDYAKDYKEALREVAQGRAGGSLFKMISENNPNIDTSIYKEIMATIEGKRDGFKRAQDVQIDLQREHNILRTKFPTSIIVGSRPALELKLVTSSRTNKAFETGVDDDVTLK